MVAFRGLNFIYLFILLCRVGKGLLGKSTEAPSFYLMRMNQKMVVISVLSLKCVRKSNYPPMCAKKRLKRLSESTHGSFSFFSFLGGVGGVPVLFNDLCSPSFRVVNQVSGDLKTPHHLLNHLFHLKSHGKLLEKTAVNVCIAVCSALILSYQLWMPRHVPAYLIYVFNAVNRGDKDEMFSIGQTLRIRIGPLKGYLCRVLAIRHSDVTVKLDSQHKVLTGLLMVVCSYFVGFGFCHCYDI